MIDYPNFVRDFGAVGDDLQNNTVAWIAFEAAAKLAGAGFIPPGRFRAAEFPWTSTARLFGAGEKATFLRRANNAPGNALAAVAAAPDNGLRIEDLQILPQLAPNAGGSCGIYLVDNSTTTIRNVIVEEQRLGVALVRSYACKIENSMVARSWASAIWTLDEGSSNGLSILRNSMFSCGLGSGSPAINLMRSWGCLEIIGNDIEGCYGAMWLDQIAAGKVCSNWMEHQIAYNIKMVNCGAALDVSGNFEHIH